MESIVKILADNVYAACAWLYHYYFMLKSEWVDDDYIHNESFSLFIDLGKYGA